MFNDGFGFYTVRLCYLFIILFMVLDIVKEKQPKLSMKVKQHKSILHEK